MWAISTKDDNSHLASCLRDLADLPVPDLFKVVVRKWFSKLCWKLSFTPSLSGQQRWRPSAPGCPSCTAPDQPGYRVGSDLSFYNFICFLLSNLNEEDEDDAEPPEFHCSENCAKDVALRSFSLSSWYISQGSPAQLLFICSLLYLSILSCGSCWKLPERLRRDPRGCSEWSHLIKIIFEELTITNMVDMN